MKATFGTPVQNLSPQALAAARLPPDVRRFRSRKAARTRAAHWIEQFDPNTTDPHQAVRFELHSRGLTFGDLAKGLGVGEKYLLERFGGRARQRSFSPALLNRVIRFLKVPPRRARELNTLAARHAGWEV